MVLKGRPSSVFRGGDVVLSNYGYHDLLGLALVGKSGYMQGPYLVALPKSTNNSRNRRLSFEALMSYCEEVQRGPW